MKQLFSLLTMLCLGILALDADVVVEAEDAQFDGKVANNHSGYSGSGFVDVANKSGSYILFQFSIAEDMPQAIVKVRWANGKDDSRDIEVQANGVLQYENFPMGPSVRFHHLVGIRDDTSLACRQKHHHLHFPHIGGHV